MKTRSNERLCAQAQKGDENARSLLLEKNYGFICQTAAELYRSMNLGESDLGIEMDDLTQEGSNENDRRLLLEKNNAFICQTSADL